MARKRPLPVLFEEETKAVNIRMDPITGKKPDQKPEEGRNTPAVPYVPSPPSAPSAEENKDVPASKPPQFHSDYAQEAQELYRQLQERKDFSYDPSQDENYLRERENYRAQARLAQEDAAGQAAALTGGYGSSYAGTVGQQAYNSRMAAFDSRASELYAQALAAYIRRGEALEGRYARASEQMNQDRERYEAALQDYRQEQSDQYSRMMQWRKLLGHAPSYSELRGLGLTSDQIRLVLGEGAVQ